MRERDGEKGRLDARATRGRGGWRREEEGGGGRGFEGARARSKLGPHGRLNAETRHLLCHCLRISFGAGSNADACRAGSPRGARLQHEAINCLYKM